MSLVFLKQKNIRETPKLYYKKQKIDKNGLSVLFFSVTDLFASI